VTMHRMRHKVNESYRPRRSHATCGLLAIVAILLAGCGIGTERKSPLELEVRKLQQEKADLAADLEQCRIDNAQVRQQVQALTALPKDGRENPYRLTSVRIARFTGFYDRNENGRRDELLVYLQPIDENGDVVKAAGTVNVELWNLNNPADQALLGQWQVPPGQLRTLWFAALVSSYRLLFDVSVTPELLAQPLTVRITFIDYLTGETFHAQHVIQPRSE
jgi:hypothetical protein